jgi:hypothetical protein
VEGKKKKKSRLGRDLMSEPKGRKMKRQQNGELKLHRQPE